MVELEIEQDARFQRRDWIAQRVGWVVLAVIAALGLAGLLGGGGPLSHAEAGDAALHASFDRFVHRHAESELELSVDPGLATDGLLRLRLDRAYAGALGVTPATPEPMATATGGNDLIYTYAVTGQSPVRLRFTIQAGSIGRHHGAIAVGTHAPVRLDQFAYP